MTEEQLLLDSPLFDHEWYVLLVGRPLTRAQAVRHYLSEGASAGLDPHPLFDCDYFVRRLGERAKQRLGDQDAFAFYLRQRAFQRRTHPLFDVQAYVRAAPDAAEHPHGPLAHYREIGAPRGLRPNGWLAPAEDGRYVDLLAWLGERAAEWRARKATVPQVWTRHRRQTTTDPAQREGSTRPTTEVSVDVVLNAGHSADDLVDTLRGLAAQTRPPASLVVVDRGGIDGLTGLLEDLVPEAIPTNRLEVGSTHLVAALNAAWRSGSATHVAFLDAGDVWVADRLRVMADFLGCTRPSPVMAADVLEGRTSDGVRSFAAHGHPAGEVRTGHAVDLARLLIARAALEEVGGFDDGLGGGHAFDLVVRLSRRHEVTVLPEIGVVRAFRARGRAHRLPRRQRALADPDSRSSWHNVVLNKRLIDWEEVARRPREPDLVSVIIPTYDDAAMTTEAVGSLLRGGPERPDDDPDVQTADTGTARGIGSPRIEVIVVDNGCSLPVSLQLDALALRHREVRVLHNPDNHGFALGNNLGLATARGEVCVFLNNDTVVPDGWLNPLLDTMSDPEVLGVQPLLVYPTGSIQSAGVGFPSTGGLPHALLTGFPIEDAEGLGGAPLNALTGAALVVRTRDAVALEGFDPAFTNGMEDVDFCQRLARERGGGSFRLRPDVHVTHFESRTPGRYDKAFENRAIYQARWRGVDEPRDDVALWAAAGYRVVDHQLDRTAEWQDRDLCIPRPVLLRSARTQVREGPPRLRWAIKNPAPFGPEAEVWGDTHFARSLAKALRDNGQDVVIDHRGEFERDTSRHDDVALVLRGLAPFQSSAEQVSIGWVISHPEMLTRREAASYDRLLGASRSWSREVSASWGIAVEPMLQATDPDLFDPDRAEPDTGHPVLFVGSSRKIYRPVVRDAVELGLALSVYGRAWSRYIPGHFIKSTYLDNDELGSYYRAAGVVLNDHWEDMRVQGFVSNRLFDAVASGARVVSDEIEGLAELFGRSVQVYRGREDLLRLTTLRDPDAVFGADGERRAVAERVRREHSFHARAVRLVEIAVEARKARGFDAHPA